MTDKTELLNIRGMTCASCVEHVRKALESVPGVLAARVNLATGSAQVTLSEAAPTPAQLSEAVRRAGYEVAPAGAGATSEDETERDFQQARRRIWLAWGCTLPIMVAMALHMVFGLAWPNMRLMHQGILALALLVLFGAGGPTFLSAWRSARHGAPNMDALIALGAGVSLLTGIAHQFAPALPDYAGVSAMIMAFHLTGRAIEARARGRSSQAIRKLMALGAKTARVLKDGVEHEVPVSELKPGDLMLVRPGEKIPTDGQIVEGEGDIDESMATGESMPVTRGPGDPLLGATLNQNGLLKVTATRVGGDTFLAQVVRMVQAAQGDKVPIQAFADRVTAWFVPAMLVVALITFLVWMAFPGLLLPLLEWVAPFAPWVDPARSRFAQALLAAVSVLVIACPCALGLATPVAIMVGTGMGAERGILFRSGEAIQTLRAVRSLVFDKTGTLTRGAPDVTDLAVTPDPRADADAQALRHLLKSVASLEQGSEHPLGKTIVRRARLDGIQLPPVSRFRALRGKGVEGEVEGAFLRVGSRAFLAEAGLDVSAWETGMQALESDGKTVVLAAADQTVLGAIALADTLKPDAVETLRELAQMGFETLMLTGDNQRTARAIANQAGIGQVVAEVLPDDKLDVIRKLQARQKGGVAMVGDGINDAPALTMADVGMAIGAGAEIAIEASDITLVSERLGGVIDAITLSRATFRKVVQGLFWAFGYNVVMIPLAMIGLMHPVLAEIAMACSSISVVVNANRLRRMRWHRDLA